MTRITPATTKASFKTLAHLANLIWTEHYTPIIGEHQVAYMLEKFQSETAIEDQVNDGVLYYLISYRDKPVGYFSVSRQEEFLFLSKLYIEKSARGKGLGRAAISYMEKMAKDFDLKRIRLTVNKFNTNSIEAYQKMGFLNMDAIVQDIGNGFVMDDYVLEKILD